MQEESQDKLLQRLEGGARAASLRDRAVPGRFVSRESFSMAVHVARQHDVSVSMDGGYPDAERCQICFHPKGEEPVYTARWMEISWNSRFGSLTHPELLGSLMSLGLDRSYFGDLLCEEQTAHLFLLPEAEVQVRTDWKQAGRVSIAARMLEETPVLALPQGRVETITSASLRLDSILSGGMHLSRSKAADLIRGDLVMVNHLPENRPDRLLEAGDLLSVRGHGRIRLTEVGGVSRKGRTYVRLECFLHATHVR